MESTERIKGINFSFFSETEITRLAALEVKSQIAFDAFRNPWPEGLYDSRMGVSPYDRSGRCPTCGKDQHDCNGHLGFIRLVLPVYHLFLLKDLLRLLRAKCFFCDKFVAANTKLKEFRKCKKDAMEAGTVIDSVTLAAICASDPQPFGIPGSSVIGAYAALRLWTANDVAYSSGLAGSNVTPSKNFSGLLSRPPCL